MVFGKLIDQILSAPTDKFFILVAEEDGDRTYHPMSKSFVANTLENQHEKDSDPTRYRLISREGAFYVEAPVF